MDTLSSEVTQTLVETLGALTKNDELFKSLASVYRKTFLSLVEAGFTEEQAMQIVSRQGFK